VLWNEHFIAIWTFKGRFVYFWKFGRFCSHLVDIFPVWYFVPRKIWQPWLIGKNLPPTLQTEQKLFYGWGEFLN
jgi:hypothetical protein